MHDLVRTLISDAAQAAHPALFDADRRTWISYGDLRKAVEAGARQLPQDRKALIALEAGNSASDVVAYLAAQAAGHAVMLCDPTLPSSTQARILDAYGADLVVGQTARSWTDGNSGYETVANGISGLSASKLKHPDPRPLHPSLSLLLSTSGSTGSSKYVRLSFANLEANASAIVKALKIHPDARALSNLPIHYAYGLSVVNSHLAAGASVVPHKFSMLDAEFWALAHATQARSVPGVPFHYDLLRRIGFDRIRNSSIRTMTQAGGRLAPEMVVATRQALDAVGGQFFVMYGQTEATARISTLDHDEIPDRPASVGRVIPGGALVIDAADGSGAAGEITYAGPNVMLGYASNREDLSRGDDCGGRLKTGDLGHLDERGYLFVTGRRRRMIKIAGKRINLDEVEALARAFAPVAVAGRDDELSLFVEASSPAPSPREVAELIGVQIAAIRIRSLDALPRTSNGKIDYPALQNLL